jgi:uncharacterized protein (DUF2384 family)
MLLMSTKSASSKGRKLAAQQLPKRDAVKGTFSAKSQSANAGSRVAKAESGSAGARAKSKRTGTAISRPKDWAAQERTTFLLDNFGGVTKLASALDVSKSQPSRWRTGEEVPGPEAAGRLLDLDHVFAYAMQAWDPGVVTDWLESPNGFLDGARPIDVLRQRGASDVVAAIRATISGAYA